MIYLYGNNSVAENIYDELESSSLKVNSIIVDDEYFIDTSSNSFGLKILPFSKLSFNKEDIVYNCIGYSTLNKRVEIGERLKKFNVLGTFISKYASIGNSVIISAGTVILGNSTVERNVKIGNSCLIWGGARVCHDAVLESGVFLASGSIIGGYSVVGRFTSVGFNSSVKERITVPPHTKVGANRYYCGK